MSKANKYLVYHDILLAMVLHIYAINVAQLRKYMILELLN